MSVKQISVFIENKIGGLEFFYNSREITYEILTEFIKSEVLKCNTQINQSIILWFLNLLLH